MDPFFYRDLFSAQGLAELVFLVMVAVTVAGALIATNANRLIRAVGGLSVCFIGVSALFYYLNSPFVAMMELLIYVGAVCVAIVFAIMLADPGMEKNVGKQGGIGTVFGFICGGMVFLGVTLIGLSTDWPEKPATLANDGSLAEVGKALLYPYSMVFELISVLLLVAIIGALVVAREGRSKSL